MIGVLARGDLRQQARSGQTFVDDGDRHAPDGDMVMTLRQGILETHVLADEQARRPIIELLADVLAELLADVAAARTTSVRLGKRVLRANPWQTLGQLLAAALAFAVFAVTTRSVVGQGRFRAR